MEEPSTRSRGQDRTSRRHGDRSGSARTRWAPGVERRGGSSRMESAEKRVFPDDVRRELLLDIPVLDDAGRRPPGRCQPPRSAVGTELPVDQQDSGVAVDQDGVARPAADRGWTRSRPARRSRHRGRRRSRGCAGGSPAATSGRMPRRRPARRRTGARTPSPRFRVETCRPLSRRHPSPSSDRRRRRRTGPAATIAASLRTYASASGAPTSRSIPASSHSTDSGPV